MKRIIASLLCALLLMSILAIPASAWFEVTYYNEEVYAGAVLDLYAFVPGDVEDYTFQWQFAGIGSGSGVNLDDNDRYKGTKTNHLQLYTSSDGDYTHWDEIPFFCKITKDGDTQYTPDIYMHVYSYDSMLKAMKNWGMGLYTPQLTNVSNLRSDDDVNYYGETYAGSKINVLCGGSVATQKTILANSEVELRREIRIAEANKYISVGDNTVYIPYTVDNNAVKIEVTMRIIMAGVDKGVFDTKTITLNTKRPEKLARGVTTAACSILRYTYNESQVLRSLPKSAVVDVVGEDGGYYQVYSQNVVGYVPKGLMRVDTPVSSPVIQEVDLTIDAPVAGQNPAFTCQFQSLGCELYKTEPISWYDRTAGKYVYATDQFQAGHDYDLVIWVAAKSGYRFQLDASGNPNLKGSINGNLPPFINKAYEQLPEQVVELTYRFSNIPKAPSHTCGPVKVEKVAPTCTKPGHEAYYRCSCGKCYSDANGTNPIDPETWGILATVAHKPGNWTGNGTHHYKKCQVCYQVITGTNAPHSGGKASCVAKATCAICNMEYGQTNEDHVPEEQWSARGDMYHMHLCKLCGAHCDVDSHVPGPEATEKEPQRCTVCDYILQPAKNHKHELTKVEEVPATCVKPGNVAYYSCSGCSSRFADAEGKEELPAAMDVTVGALGHRVSESWQFDADFHWSVCQVCGAVLDETRMEHDMQTGTCSTCGYDGQFVPETTEPTVPAETQPQSQNQDPPANFGWIWILIAIVVALLAVALAILAAIVLLLKKK